MNALSVGPQGFVESHGESIYFQSYGAGETILLGHGRGGNHAIWFKQVPILAQHYHVVTWDQRGFGRSSNHQDEPTPQAAAQDIQVLLDHLDVERAHLVGQSLGGWAVVESTLRWPERTQSLILANTIAGIYTPEIKAAYEAYVASRANLPQETDISMDGHAVLENETDAENLTRAFLYNQIGKFMGQPPASASPSIRNTAFAHDALHQIKAPTLFITGEHDAIFPPSSIRLAAQLIPNAQVVEIPDADHSPYFETPSVWNETVMRFLRDVSAIGKF